MNGICNVLPLEDLHILKVAYDHDKWSTEAWINIFGRLLARPASGAVRTATTTADLFFRHLKSLQVSEVDLLNIVEHEGDERPFNDLLAEWLSTRMQVFMDELEDADGDDLDGESDEDGGDNGQNGGRAGRFGEDSRLGRLVITQCSVTEEYVDELEDYVQDVVWDEDEGIYKEESEEGSVGGSY
ncbi:hypothetical protein EWM64_g4493 [Hericium alpestre]|uniref:Pre-rRNA-processing protein TSR2 n=1 Tax=Hericium alpestre TaxID=135208 RepID=A0A4Y9ZZD5_9AGAM|nr:hypothetical protein EWM64_g4493 [Hericium alpestre]